MPPPVLIDVTPRALVVETAGGYCDTIIPRNAQIPCERTRAFATAQDGQQVVRVRVAQGRGRRVPREHVPRRSGARRNPRRAARRGERLGHVRARRRRHPPRSRGRYGDRAPGSRELRLEGIAGESDIATMRQRWSGSAPSPRGSSRWTAQAIGAWLRALDDFTYYVLLGVAERRERRRAQGGVPRLRRDVPPRWPHRATRRRARGGRAHLPSRHRGLPRPLRSTAPRELRRLAGGGGCAVGRVAPLVAPPVEGADRGGRSGSRTPFARRTRGRSREARRSWRRRGTSSRRRFN